MNKRFSNEKFTAAYNPTRVSNFGDVMESRNGFYIFRGEGYASDVCFAKHNGKHLIPGVDYHPWIKIKP